MIRVINADFATMVKHYCKHDKLHTPIRKLLADLVEMTRLENEKIKKYNAETTGKKKDLLGTPTPCCFQLSHSLNAAGVTVPATNEFRGALYKPEGGNGYYFGNVYEVEDFLSKRYDVTDDIKAGNKDRAQMKTIIFGRQGILLFRDAGYGFHAELWDKHDILQREGISGGMTEDSIFSQPRVLFYEVTKAQRKSTMPDWLTGWWSVKDAYQYYYHFVGLDYVYWTEERPTDAATLKHSSKRGNYGNVVMKPEGPVVTWNTKAEDQTIETFRNHDGASTMMASSNRFGWLKATKMFL